jgi:putative addiction module killer protein
MSGRAICIYFGNISNVVVLLLCGGDKRTKKTDIKRAKEFRSDYQEHAEEE